jgi:phosphonate transport system permease protein
MSETTAGAPPPAAEIRAAAHARFGRRMWMGFGVLAAILAYLAYAWVALGISGLIASAEPERAVLLGTDSIAYKVHVTEDLRRGGLEVAVEGERRATYDEPPGWVEIRGEASARVDLGEGYRAEIDGRTVRLTVPDYGTVIATATEDGVEVETPPGPVPDWARISEVKFDARPTLFRRVQITRSKIEVHRYFLGWENFWFPFGSELNRYGFGELAALALDTPEIPAGMDASQVPGRLDDEMSNAAYIFDTFWTNPDWQHGHVFVALLETIMMAVLGTMTAVLVGLPLAFVAASNFTFSMVARFFTRRLFDFVRGIDNLIWSLIFIRAFGLGPLTGALAIAVTDTGTLGKLFSEALENVDNRQIEGVRATGASQMQRYRFGVIPQILPVFISQTLYYLESNTRSATVIGALGAGGIGLVLVETMRTARDWENTLYIIVLTVLVVIAMDSLSSWLRRKLIRGE